MIDWLNTEWTTADGEVWTYLDYIIYVDIVVAIFVSLGLIIGIMTDDKFLVRICSVWLLLSPLNIIIAPLVGAVGISAFLYHVGRGIWEAWH